MEKARLMPFAREQDMARICLVLRQTILYSFATEFLEIRAKEPSLHDFVEELYEILSGQASITAIGHISHSQKDAEHGRLFSLHEQIDHKTHAG
ncbi:hypothetical protein GUJ93_ZPchr0012g19721 [Zizania palustris]|uniref:Uncharacterized protein n=1 Tax=Zizania palustris TaxID=103762 RepID=A0A8J6BVF8_ZIZPA|nr:hypothetical protein GUJ93_ZPchr0012g19721 [Zizania palustris]